MQSIDHLSFVNSYEFMKKTNENLAKTKNLSFDTVEKVNHFCTDLLEKLSSHTDHQVKASKLYPVVIQAQEVLKTMRSIGLDHENLTNSLNQLIDAFKESYRQLPLSKKSNDPILSPSQWMVENAEANKTALAQITFDTKRGVVVIPSRVVEQSLSDLLIKSYCSKQEIAEASLQHQAYSRANSIQPTSGYEWKAAQVSRLGDQYTIHYDQLYPTTAPAEEMVKLTGIGKLSSNIKVPVHLTNLHYQIREKGQLCISCGVIDSKEKAGELFQLIKAIKGNENCKVIINQLNSYTGEAVLVESEHSSALYLNHLLQNKNSKLNQLNVAHFNHTINASSQAPYNMEDYYSYQQNQLGAAALLTWVGISNIEIQKTSQLILGIKTQIQQYSGNADVDTREVQKQLAQEQTKLQRLLHTARKQCQEESKACIDTDFKRSMMLDILSTMIALESNASDKPVIERTQEIEMHLLFTMLLQSSDPSIVEVTNCKSGLDRTGLVKALGEGLKDMLQKYLSEGSTENDAFAKVKDLVMNMDKNCLELDAICEKLSTQHKETIAEKLKDVDSLEANPAILTDLEQTLQDKTTLKDTWIYRQFVLKSLLQVGLPATIESTGVGGLKYGHKNKTVTRSTLTANPHPFKRIPSLLLTEDNKVIQLQRTIFRGGWLQTAYTYNWPTDAGIELLLRNSKYRGA